MNAEAEEIITQLGLVPLPREGGYFRQNWLSPHRLANGRPAGSGIWFLLTPGNFSALHRLQAEESWCFFEGDPVEHVQLFRPAQSPGPVEGLDPAEGLARVQVLGPDLPSNHRQELLVPGGVWQGARILACAQPRGWALMGCTMKPAWDEQEFELGRQADLAREFPGALAWIRALTR